MTCHQVLMLPHYANPYQEALVARLRPLGFEVRLAQPSVATLLELLSAPPPAVVHVHWLEWFFKPIRAWRAAPLAAKVGGLGRALLGLLGLASARLRGAQVVFTFHELHDHEGRYRRIKSAYAFLVAHLSCRVLVHSQYAAREVRTTLGVRAAKVSVVRHTDPTRGYPASPGRAEARAECGLKPAHRVLLFLGYVAPYKGVEELLEAFRALRAPDARLVVAGQPFPPEYARRLADLAGDDPRIDLQLEHVSDLHLVRLAAAADLLVYPFRAITTTSSVLLATGLGRPALAPRLGNIPELLDERSAFLYPAGELANGLRRAWDDWEHLAAMGQAAAERHAVLCGEGVAQDHAAAYRERAT